MNRWTKIGAAAAALLLAGSAGAVGSAWAGDTPNPPVPHGGPKLVTPYASGIVETKFVPIVPCRIVDTRAAGGHLAVGSVRIFKVTGTGNSFAAQGGKANGCGIPGSATAVEATVTAVNSGSGFLRAWPANQSAPNATFLNYTDMLNVSNTGTLAINGCTAICLPNRDLALRAYGSSTDVVVDVNGYYETPMTANVSNTGTLVRGSRTTTLTHPGTGLYTVKFDRDISQCTYFAGTATADGGVQDGYATVTNLGVDSTGVFVETFNTAGTKADLSFQVQVVC